MAYSAFSCSCVTEISDPSTVVSAVMALLEAKDVSSVAGRANCENSTASATAEYPAVEIKVSDATGAMV